MTARSLPRRNAAAVALLAAMAVGAPSAAEEPPLPVPAPSMPPDCRAEPDNGLALPDDETGDLTTGALADCDGVLAPPRIGDAEMVTPAPPVGETPVIRPEDIGPDGGPEPVSPD
jgi:hypothetical protein